MEESLRSLYSGKQSRHKKAVIHDSTPATQSGRRPENRKEDGRCSGVGSRDGELFNGAALFLQSETSFRYLSTQSCEYTPH